MKTLCWRFSLLCEKSTKSCSSRDAPSGPRKARVKDNKNVAQNAKQRHLYYPNLERREADASELQASQHSTGEASHRGHRCCRPTRPRPPAPFDETSARLTTTTTEVSYRAQPGSPRRFPARPVLSLSFFLFFCRFRGPPDSRSRSRESEPPEMPTTKFPPSSSIAALLTSTLPPPSAHWYPYCKQLLLERLLLVF